MEWVWLIIVSVLFVAMSAGFIFGFAAEWQQTSSRSRLRKGAHLVGTLLLLIGLTGFLGAAFSALGGLRWLPKTVEFPMGFAEHSATDNKGQLYCGSMGWARIQVYDWDRHFLRGWFVNAYGGTFRLHVNGDGNLEIATARQGMLYVYDENGRLLSSQSDVRHYFEEFEHQDEGGVLIPTRWFLWPFTNPFIGFGVLMVGMLFLGLARHTKQQAKGRVKG